MEPPDIPEEERYELTVLAMLELLRRLEDPVKPPGKLIPFPKPQAIRSTPTKRGPQPKPGPSLKLIAADHTPGC
jgi:hypothetical protein